MTQLKSVPIALFAVSFWAGAQAQTVDLLCRAEVNGRPALVQVFHIDYAHKTVNDMTAVFERDEINWVTITGVAQGQVQYVDHTLNRVAGTYRSAQRAFALGMPPLYACEKAPAPKF